MITITLYLPEAKEDFSLLLTKEHLPLEVPVSGREPCQEEKEEIKTEIVSLEEDPGAIPGPTWMSRSPSRICIENQAPCRT